MNSHDLRRRRPFAVLLPVVLVLGLTLGQAAFGAPSARADPDLCGLVNSEALALEQKVADVKARIQAHNAESINQYSKAAVDAYNARAAQLHGEKDGINAQIEAATGRLNTCNVAARRLEAAGPPMNSLTQQDKSELAAANAGVSKGWRAQTPLTKQPNGNVSVPKDSPMRPHFDIFDRRKIP